jgi:hypothetical protein
MAAGLGFKTFNTGDVLSAADTNGYLMQGVLVFADAAARTAAITSPQEGQMSFLKDTNSTEYYSGSAWVAVGGSSVPSSLEYASGKNKIINGAMNVWQRGTSFTLAQGDTYTVDRMVTGMSSISTGTITASQQAFTAGAAPVAGYESQYFWRIAGSGSVTGLTYLATDNTIEDVRTLAGQTVTYSFWGKADSNRTQAVEFLQVFGTGGSSTVTTSMGNVNLTTSWQRFTLTVTAPSVSGKTIGAGNHIRLRLYHPQNVVFNNDLWGLQLEEGSTATDFQTATGTFQGELAACQRYYWRVGASNSALGQGMAQATTGSDQFVTLKVTMRATPTTLDFADLLIGDGINAAVAFTSATIFGGANSVGVNGSASGLTQYRVYSLRTGASGYLGIGAEL